MIIYGFHGWFKRKGFTEYVDLLFDSKPLAIDILKEFDKIERPPNMLLAKNLAPLREYVELGSRAALSGILIDNDDVGYHIEEHEVVELGRKKAAEAGAGKLLEAAVEHPEVFKS
jgi:hypothetical protein